ncbi:glycoside hydrolase, partial [Rhizoctonia solani]
LHAFIMLAKVAFTLLSVASSVLAHGNLQEIVVENPPATFIPWLPFQDPYKNPLPERVGRKIPDNGPVEDVTSIDIQCNKGAVPAALIATAAAGSNVALNWTDWPTSHIGPVITYLAKAPSDITKWSPGTDKVWFKIDEAGLDNGKWAGTDVLLSQNGLWTVKIPQSLQPGQYLMRHEIIALHGAQNYPGAQFYPSCIQFEITGSGTALPNDSDLVSFPGAYSPTDPGVKYNPYVGATTYPIPGPPV